MSGVGGVYFVPFAVGELTEPLSAESIDDAAVLLDPDHATIE
jgi:hypothetical protein